MDTERRWEGKRVKHPLTDIGIEKFLADWKKLEKK